MRKQIELFLLISLFPLFFIGCAVSVKEYLSLSAEEKAIVSVLIKWQETWNNHDVSGNLSLWLNDAKIKYGIGRNVSTKEELKAILPKDMASVGRIKLYTPKIEIFDNKASVNVLIVKFDDYTIRSVTFDLRKENNHWFLARCKYDN